MILNLILIAIATEALVEIIVASELFYPLHRWAFFTFGWEKLCGYCASFWVAVGLWSYQDDPLVKLLIMVLVVHRLSNLLHEGFSRWFKRTPNVSVNSVYIKK